MSSKTSNYNLHKIDLTDAPPDITVLNPNWDTIDSTMKTLDTGVSDAKSAASTAQTAATNAQSTADGKAPKSHASSDTTYGVGTDTNYGHLKLSGSVSSTLDTTGGTAATPGAVKSAYDLANTANTTAGNAMPKSGGTFTGNVKAYSTNRYGDTLRNITVQNSSSTEVSTNRIIMKRK